jgi:hypothetical protein
VVLIVFDVIDEDGNQVPSHRCSGSVCRRPGADCRSARTVRSEATIWIDEGPARSKLQGLAPAVTGTLRR